MCACVVCVCARAACVCVCTLMFMCACLCCVKLYAFSFTMSVHYLCRYSREEPFTALNVNVRHHDNLYESLDAFVKGDLLEGANAYHWKMWQKSKHSSKNDNFNFMGCNRLWCNFVLFYCTDWYSKEIVHKQATVPQILVIQLKRFDCCYERCMYCNKFMIQ